MKLRSPSDTPVHIALRDGGHTTLITPEGVDVEQRFVREAMALGCRIVGVEMDGPFQEAESIDRTVLIVKAIQDMLDGSNEGDFTADGKPNLGALAKRVGFQVSREERDAAWATVTV